MIKYSVVGKRELSEIRRDNEDSVLSSSSTRGGLMSPKSFDC